MKNYTGDLLNFGLAAEMARSDGLDVSEASVCVCVRGGGGGGGWRWEQLHILQKHSRMSLPPTKPQTSQFVTDLQVRMVVVGDDVALAATAAVGRRGVAGTVRNCNS